MEQAQLDKIALQSIKFGGYMDANVILKEMKKEHKKQRSLEQSHSEKQLKKISQTNVQQSKCDDFFSSTQNSFLVSEKPQLFNNKSVLASSPITRQNSEAQNQSFSQNIFRKTTDAFKQKHRQNQQINQPQNSLAATLSNYTQSKFFFPAQSKNENGFKQKLSERINQSQTTNGDIFSPTVPSTASEFKSFRDIMQTQHKNILKKFLDSNIKRQDKIKQQLIHNNTQMNIIKNQIETERINSFDNIFNMKKYTDDLINKSGSAKKITLQDAQRKDIFKQQPYNIASVNGQSHQMAQYFPPSINLINQSSNQEIDENNPNDQQQTNPEDLYFHWEKIYEYSKEMKPEFREGATLVEYKSKFILYGGFGFELMNNIYQYRIRDQKWIEIETSGEIVPSCGRFGHSANIYGNQMVVFGGGGDYNFKAKNRLVFNELWFLNLDTYVWKQLRTTGDYVEPRRHHAACVVSNKFYVFGGVNTKERYISAINVLQLDKGRWKSFNFKQDDSGVAFHQVVPIFKKYLKLQSGKTQKIVSLINQKVKLKVREEGIYCFGGKQGNEKLRGKLMILRCDQNDMPIEWTVPETLGQNPPARYQHSLFYNYQIKGLVLFGGRSDESNQGQGVFQDIWVLYLSNLMWININVSGNLNRYRFAHSYAIIDERMFVFGGASNISYTDCELYVLEMGKLFFVNFSMINKIFYSDQVQAMKKRNNPVRDMMTHQQSMERLEDDESEEYYQEKSKNSKKRNSGYKTFQRPPNKDELKTQQEIQVAPFDPMKLQSRKSMFFTPEFAHRCSIFIPRMRKDSMIFKPKMHSQFLQQINNSIQ